MSLRAGVARRDISPVGPVFLVGYPHVPRPSEGIHDPLYASALALRQSDGTGILLIAVDVLFIERDSADRCRRAISVAVGVAEDAVLISATHTHSGPVTFAYLAMSADPVVPPPDPAYMARFEAAIVDAAVAAWRGAVPARLAVTSARAEGLGGNRLDPAAVADPEVGLLYVVRADNRAPLGLVMTYAMHPTVLHEDSRQVSADFPGETRRLLVERLPGLTVLYHTAPAGNQSPRHAVRAQTFAEAERLGRRLGEQVHRALLDVSEAAFRDDLPLRAARRRIDLPVRTFPDAGQAERDLAAAVAQFERLQREGAAPGVVRTAECVVFGAEERVTLARAQARGELGAWVARALPAEVQVLGVGDVVIVGLPGELFVEFALELKRRTGRPTLVISLANGELQGYIVTPEADAAGGYEAACSLFSPAAGRLLLETALDLAHTPP